VLASFSPQSESQRALLAQVSEEFVRAQEVNADHPTARAALGTFYAERGRVSDAEREYRSAIDLDSTFVPAYVNLADLYRALSREADGEQVLERALAHAPEDPGLLHARGLQLVRLGRLDAAATYLRDAARLAPETPRYAYVLAVALNSAGDADGALATVRGALEAHPYDRDLLLLAVSLHRDRGELTDARRYAERLLELTPDDPSLGELLRSLGA
jgi:Flp pilus assembly protein TadD